MHGLPSHTLLSLLLLAEPAGGPGLPIATRTCSLLSLKSTLQTASVTLEDDEVPSSRIALRGSRAHAKTNALIATLPAGWFGDFSQGESTWHADGVNARQPEESAEEEIYTEEKRGDMPTAKPGKWFQETESAGAKRAWQTYYPEVGNYRSKDQQLAPWRGRADGGLQEAYRPDEQLQEYYTATAAKNPMWFDSSVSQYDAFGRGKLPSKTSRERYVEYTKRSRNASLSCKDSGCDVNSSLKIFDHEEEHHEDCKLTLLVHPTDFDDDYSREYLEVVTINNKSLEFRCSPQAEARSCGKGGDEALIPCMKDYPLDGLVKHDGMLHINSRISPMVDECPVDGNLLSGVAIVTCLVHPAWMNKPKNVKRWHPITTPPPRVEEGMLRCKEPNCTAWTTIFLTEDEVVNKTCRLTIKISQTDFDGNLGSVEEVEWVKVNGNITKSHIKPGRNPCKEQLMGNTSLEESKTASGKKAKGNSSQKEDSKSNSSKAEKTSGGKAGQNSTKSDGKSGSKSEQNSSKSDSKSGSKAAAAGSKSETASSGKGGKQGKAGAGLLSQEAFNASKKDSGKNSSDSSNSSKSKDGGAGGKQGAKSSNSTSNSSSSNSSQATDSESSNITDSNDTSLDTSRNNTYAGNASDDNVTNGTPSVVESVFGNAFGNVPAEDLNATENFTEYVEVVYGDEVDESGVPRFFLVNRSDVTAAARDGKVTVEVKISDKVDECGTDEGYLLNAEAFIVCE